MAAPRMPAVKNAMTPFPWSIAADASLDEAQAAMDEHRVHHLPVKDGHALVGVLSARDVLHARGTARRVGEACRRDPLIVDMETPLDRVLLRMAESRQDCAVVVKDERLAGIFTSTDVCRSYAEHLDGCYGDGTGDGDDAA